MHCAIASKHLQNHREQHTDHDLQGKTSITYMHFKLCLQYITLHSVHALMGHVPATDNPNLLQLLCYADHILALDVTRSELFCCSCNDYVYDPEFDACLMVQIQSTVCTYIFFITLLKLVSIPVFCVWGKGAISKALPAKEMYPKCISEGNVTILS